MEDLVPFLVSLNLPPDFLAIIDPPPPNGQKTRPGRCPEQELIVQRPLMMNQAREVCWRGDSQHP